MKISAWPLEQIKPYERNPRIHGDAIDAVARSIETFGFRQPIVVDADGVIVVGHARYFAAVKLKLKRAPVHVANDLTPDQVKAYRIADNKVGELSEWDLEKLGLEFADLKAADFDTSVLAFDDDELAELLAKPFTGLTDPDQIPEPPAKATTDRGDLWILGEHRLLCGDSSKPEDLDRLLAGGTIQLVNTDPRYNVKVEPRSNNASAAGLNSFQATGKAGKQLRPKDRPLANDFVTDGEFDRLLMAWFKNLSRVLDAGRAFYVWGGFSNAGNYPPALAAAGLYFSQAIIWAKNAPVMTRKDFMGAHEWCFYGWREGAAHKFFGPRNVLDVWEFIPRQATDVQLGSGLRLEAPGGNSIDVMPPKKDARRIVKVGDDGVTLHGPGSASDLWFVRKVPSPHMVHLTEKPVELATRAMEYSSCPTETVLDLFGGSGSTLIAAQMTNRRARLIELDPLYCDVIVKRWEDFTGLKAKRETAPTTTATTTVSKPPKRNTQIKKKAG